MSASQPWAGTDFPYLDDYATDLLLQGKLEGTVEGYTSCLKIFLEWLGGDPVAVNRRDLKEFLMHLTHDREAKTGEPGLASETIHKYFISLNSYYKFLKYEGYIDENIIPEFRDRYVDSAGREKSAKRQLISVSELATLVHGTLDVRNRAMIVTLAKTGVRRNELSNIDLDDIDWEAQSIELKPTRKRTNMTVFFDGECARVLQRWMRARDEQAPDTDALFVNHYGGRLGPKGITDAVTAHAEAVGLHDPESPDLEDRFTPHCCRHWFTTHLRRAGMQREFIQELRGDTRGDAIDIYDHIDKPELRESYLAHIPTLGL